MAAGIRWVRTLCKKLAGESRTVFVSSHVMAEMALSADYGAEFAFGLDLILDGLESGRGSV